jgi:hypothetical protein
MKAARTAISPDVLGNIWLGRALGQLCVTAHPRSDQVDAVSVTGIPPSFRPIASVEIVGWADRALRSRRLNVGRPGACIAKLTQQIWSRPNSLALAFNVTGSVFVVVPGAESATLMIVSSGGRG